MQPFKTLSTAFAFGLISSVAFAEEWRGPVLTHEVGVDVPAEFGATPSFTDANAESALVEFQLPGETQQVWTQMFTVTAYADPSGQPADQSAGAMAGHLLQGYSAACPTSFAAEDMGSPALAGAEAVMAGWLSCGDTGGGTSESMVVLVAVKEGTIFTVQWAERGPASATPLSLDMNHWLPRLDQLMTLSL